MVAKVLLALLVTACASAPRPDRANAPIKYWEALAGLDADGALAAARTPAEKQFAVSVRNLMSGELAAAERGFDLLRRSATDSLIRSGSRVMHVATLQYQEKWTQLANIAPDTVHPDGARPDRAGIQRWAHAFRGIPPRISEFRARSIEIPMSVSEVGTPLVRVYVGDEPFNFWLDTGSSMTMLASDVARALGVKPLAADTLEVVTSTGRIGALPALIPVIQVGQLVMRNVPTMIVDEAILRVRERRPVNQGQALKIDGIVGFDIIRRLDIEVDYAARILRLRDPAHSGRMRERNMFWVGLPVVRLTSMTGVPLNFAVDTGAELTFVTETLLDRLELDASRIERHRVGGLGGEMSVTAPVLPDLRVRLRGYPMVFRGAAVRAPVYQVLAALDGVLGGDVWSAGLVRIDVTNGVFSVRGHRSR
jgi:predicted aspartyl protease